MDLGPAAALLSIAASVAVTTRPWPGNAPNLAPVIATACVRASGCWRIRVCCHPSCQALEPSTPMARGHQPPRRDIADTGPAPGGRWEHRALLLSPRIPSCEQPSSLLGGAGAEVADDSLCFWEQALPLAQGAVPNPAWQSGTAPSSPRQAEHTHPCQGRACSPHTCTISSGAETRLVGFLPRFPKPDAAGRVTFQGEFGWDDGVMSVSHMDGTEVKEAITHPVHLV